MLRTPRSPRVARWSAPPSSRPRTRASAASSTNPTPERHVLGAPPRRPRSLPRRLPRRGGRRPRPRPRRRSRRLLQIQSQDAILREYQRENEAAAATLADAKRLAADVESKLRAELADAADESARPAHAWKPPRIVGDARTSADAGDASRHPPRPRRTRDTRAREQTPSAMAEALARHLEGRETRRARRNCDALNRRTPSHGLRSRGLDALRIAPAENARVARRRRANSRRFARVEWFTENQRDDGRDETARTPSRRRSSADCAADRELANPSGSGSQASGQERDENDRHERRTRRSRRPRDAIDTRAGRSSESPGDWARFRRREGEATSSAPTPSAKATPADPRDQSSAGSPRSWRRFIFSSRRFLRIADVSGAWRLTPV